MKIIKTMAPLLAMACVALTPTPALAGKAEFNATVSPATLSLSVNAQGGITGNRQVTVTATRTRVGASAACNKIKAVEVYKGVSFGNEPVGAVSLGKKGRCYFNNLRILATPFSDDEIRNVCGHGVSGVQRLQADGRVAAFNATSNNVAAYRTNPSMLEKFAKSEARIRFAANVTCSGAGHAPSGPAPSSTSGNSQRNAAPKPLRTRADNPTGPISPAQTTAVPSHPGKKAFNPKQPQVQSKGATRSIKGCKKQNGQIVCSKPAPRSVSDGVNKMMGGKPTTRSMAEQCEWTCKVECSGTGSRRKCVWVCRGSGPECEGTPFP